MKRTLTATIVIATLAVTGLLAATAPAMAQHDKAGYIYGKVTTRTDNVYTGLLRWADEEAFWDDLFHSYKEKLPYAKYLEEYAEQSDDKVSDLRDQIRDVERESRDLRHEIERVSRQETRTKDKASREELAEQRRELEMEVADLEMKRAQLEMKRAQLEALSHEKKISVLGGAIEVKWNPWSVGSRIFIARFGDIDKIEVIGSEDAELTMRSGTAYVVSGYANDVGGKVIVRDASLGDIELDWRKIKTINFMETPRNVRPEGYRLSGTLESDAGEFRGYIQWDSEECLSTDKLDGDSEDGSLSIEMGQIKKIERRSRSSSWVTLRDGRRLHLEGSNDVDESIRGIMVEDERYGRVKVPWNAFVQLVFDDAGKSGPGYDSYGKAGNLKGVVTDMDGNKLEGRIVYDIDEAEGWEMLNGDLFDIEFNIPFRMVKMIQPRSRNSSLVTLVNGEELRLEGGQDVSSNNDGLLVFDKGDDNPTYIDWDRIERIEFKH